MCYAMILFIPLPKTRQEVKDVNFTYRKLIF